MHTLRLFEEIHHVGTREEANEMYRSHPENRGRIWLSEEVKRAMLLDAHEVAEIVKQKQADHAFVFGYRRNGRKG